VRCLVGFVFLALVAVPLSVSAQAGEEGATSSEPAREEGGLSPRVRKRTRQKWDPHVYEVPSSEPATEEPALQLKLDDAGVDVVPSPLRTADGYTLEEMELRVKRANIGLGVSVGAVGLGLVLTTVGGLVSLANTPLGGETEAPAAWAAMVAGLTLMAGGAAGMIVSVALISVRKRKLRELQRAHYGTPRRVQWDVARSRVVF
jgi:hypothetical protein